VRKAPLPLEWKRGVIKSGTGKEKVIIIGGKAPREEGRSLSSTNLLQNREGEGMAIDSKEAGYTAIELAERIRRHPELLVPFEEYLDVVDNCAGDVGKADEAEQRFIEVLRKLGRQGMQAWAERKRLKVEAESDKRQDLTKKEKKGSTGIQRSGK
jgi:hypothetical protein